MDREIKTVGQFIDLVSSMRKAQKRAAKTFSIRDTNNAKSLEKQVDAVLRDRESRKKAVIDQNQPSLF